MSAGLVIGAIAGVVVIILLIWFISTWNRLVRLEENVNKSWADIDVLLKQRYDMIPNLVNTVKGYATHEKDIFEQFALARQTAAGALASGDVRGVGAAEGTIAALMPRINMVAEQYPELKADSSFVNLQNQLVSIENQVSDRREFYNSSATNWNAAIQMIPTSIVAGMKKAVRRDLFEVTDPVQREAVKVEF
ncbi:MAG: LemA family protein [Candidatus Poseidoniales archaeon]|nr:LemA family protein [Candidatus Poseidoniales archaeon]RJV00624.1 MAG: LemA family protein [Candidatus Poseidoniales archaeon]|tara:strand:- start:1119 stop:1694 length:576 start_codon:yes stop_codon:yes gene_type:complete